MDMWSIRDYSNPYEIKIERRIEMKRNKIYLIDSENININGIKELLSLDEIMRKIYIFYTKNSQSIKWADMEIILQCSGQIHLIDCFTGTNALDFQLVSFMGTLICKAPKSEYIIVSDDKGYDACVSFWASRGVMISRLSKLNTQKQMICLERKQNLITSLEEMLSNEKSSFDLNKISEVFIKYNPVKKEIAPALSKTIGNKETTLFLRAVGKNNLKKLYEL